MVDGYDDEKSKFGSYSGTSRSDSKGVFVDDDANSVFTFVRGERIVVDNKDFDVSCTVVNTLDNSSLLPTELGITKKELDELSYDQLIIIVEAINREYDARAEEFERDLKEDIRAQLDKLKDRKISKNKVVKYEQMGGNVEMAITQKDVLRGQKRLALIEIARLWQMIKEQKKIRDNKREKLLDECYIMIDEKSLEDEFDEDYGRDILKRAVINVSRTAKLDASEVNEELYKKLQEKAIQRSAIQQDEFYDTVQYDVQGDIELRLEELRDQVEEEVTQLRCCQDLLEVKIRKLQEMEDTSLAQELFEDYTELEAYINTYESQKKEIGYILTTYNECKRAEVLFAKDDMWGNAVVHEIYEQIDQISSLVDSTRLDVIKRVADINDKMKDREDKVVEEKDMPDIILTKGLLWLVNLLWGSFISEGKYRDAIRTMTAEERFLTREIEIPERELKVSNRENTKWYRELFSIIKIWIQPGKNGIVGELRDAVNPYKVNNKNTLNALKSKIDGANKRKYSSYEYDNALKVVKYNLLEKYKYKLDVDRLTSEDYRVLAQMIDEEYIKEQVGQAKEVKNILLTELKDSKLFEQVNIAYRDLEKPYDDISKSYSVVEGILSNMYLQRSVVRDAFNLMIAQKDSLETTYEPDEISQSVLIQSGIVDANLYSDYVNKYEKDQVATSKDVDNMIDRVRDTSVDGGYYYVVLDDEKSDAIANIGKLVISDKGITVFKVDENRLRVDKDSGEFWITIFDKNNHDLSKFVLNRDTILEPINDHLRLSRDRLFTVEQDREFDTTRQLIEDEERILENKKTLGAYKEGGKIRISFGFEKKISEAEVILNMLEYIHTRDGNTEYDQEEKLIKELSDRLSYLKNAINDQRYNIKRLNAVLSAYEKFNSVCNLGISTEVDDDIKDILSREYNSAKDAFLKQRAHIKIKIEELCDCKSDIGKKKFCIDIRKDEKSELDQVEEITPKDFWGKVKKFFGDMLRRIKGTFDGVLQLFTPHGIHKKVDDIVADMLGIDISKGSREGAKQWLFEKWSRNNIRYKDEYMKLAKKRDEENRKKCIDGEEKKGVSLNGGNVPEDEMKNNGCKEIGEVLDGDMQSVVEAVITEANEAIAKASECLSKLGGNLHEGEKIDKVKVVVTEVDEAITKAGRCIDKIDGVLRENKETNERGNGLNK